VTYLLLADVGLGGLIAFTVVSLLLYRYVRNRPQRMLELFVNKVARIPEVRLIVCRTVGSPSPSIARSPNFTGVSTPN
jgi:hypothetical protein